MPAGHLYAEADGFLARVREVPDADEPRLIYADWLDEQGDGDRAEFIRAQIALARLPEYDRRRVELVKDVQDLLARHADAWAAPFRGLATGPVFRRGFVEEVKVTARQFLARADALFATGPVRHLHLLDLGSHLSAALVSPHLARLTGLTVFAQHLGPPLARAVADSPHLAGLRLLRLGRNKVGDAGAELIANAPLLANLDDLDLSQNDLGEPGGRALAAPRFIGLRRLELGGNAVGPLAAVQIAASDRLPALELLGLEGNRVGGPRLPAVGPAVLLRVAVLDLSRNNLTPDGLELVLSGRESAGVRELDLSQNDELGDAGVGVLAESPLTAGLHTLRLARVNLTDAGLASLAGSPHVVRLAALDVSNNPLGDDGFRALLDSRSMPALKRLAYSELSASPWMQQRLRMRLARGETIVR
jgi:uncharacterized protein (TIGR02996 family)